MAGSVAGLIMSCSMAEAVPSETVADAIDDACAQRGALLILPTDRHASLGAAPTRPRPPAAAYRRRTRPAQRSAGAARGMSTAASSAAVQSRRARS